MNEVLQPDRTDPDHPAVSATVASSAGTLMEALELLADAEQRLDVITEREDVPGPVTRRVRDVETRIAAVRDRLRMLVGSGHADDLPPDGGWFG